MSNKSADDVLTTLENAVQHDLIKRQAGRSGASPKHLHLKAKQQLLADLLGLPEMQEEDTSVKGTTTPREYVDAVSRNNLRKELRKAMTIYFMGTVGGDSIADSSKPEEVSK